MDYISRWMYTQTSGMCWSHEKHSKSGWGRGGKPVLNFAVACEDTIIIHARIIVVFEDRLKYY